jgi:predicted O-linked N-acetylglucosamine transferase (SPINDLY family)
MTLFARKPAPVQVTYLAYCSTTGLEAMDYRFTDPHLDPPGMNDEVYSEQSQRLPETYWCYPLQGQSPPISPPPALSAGEVTFSCLNNFCKVSPDALNLWMQLLGAMPKSRFILHAHEGSHRQRVRGLLENQGIDPQRLTFVGKIPLAEYFRLYQQIDIGLDAFPCNGATTTCDALWMGVPVVTLAGRTAVGHSGVSILRNVGLPELIAQTPQQYVEFARALAEDLPSAYAGIAADGCPALRPQRRIGIPPDVADVVQPARRKRCAALNDSTFRRPGSESSVPGLAERRREPYRSHRERRKSRDRRNKSYPPGESFSRQNTR